MLTASVRQPPPEYHSTQRACQHGHNDHARPQRCRAFTYPPALTAAATLDADGHAVLRASCALSSTCSPAGAAPTAAPAGAGRQTLAPRQGTGKEHVGVGTAAQVREWCMASHTKISPQPPTPARTCSARTAIIAESTLHTRFSTAPNVAFAQRPTRPGWGRCMPGVWHDSGGGRMVLVVEVRVTPPAPAPAPAPVLAAPGLMLLALLATAP